MNENKEVKYVNPDVSFLPVVGGTRPPGWICDGRYFFSDQWDVNVAFTPKPLQAGDQAMWKDRPGSSSRCEVLTVHGDWAWVEWKDAATPSTVRLDRLKRAE